MQRLSQANTAALAALVSLPVASLQAQSAPPSRSYPQLLSLFTEWRAIVGPFFAAPPHVEHFELATKSA